MIITKRNLVYVLILLCPLVGTVLPLAFSESSVYFSEAEFDPNGVILSVADYAWVGDGLFYATDPNGNVSPIVEICGTDFRITIDCSSGKVTLPEGMPVDEASRKFWLTLEEVFPQVFGERL
jgi:hypothetical protein